MTSDGRSYHRERYKQIIAEQVTIGYLTKGGVTYSETDDMSPYERRIAYETIRDILESQAESRKKSMEKSQRSRSHNKDRRTAKKGR